MRKYALNIDRDHALRIKRYGKVMRGARPRSTVRIDGTGPPEAEGQDIEKLPRNRRKAQIPFAKGCRKRLEALTSDLERFWSHMKYKKWPVLIDLNVQMLNVRRVGTIERARELK